MQEVALNENLVVGALSRRERSQHRESGRTNLQSGRCSWNAQKPTRNRANHGNYKKFRTMHSEEWFGTQFLQKDFGPENEWQLQSQAFGTVSGASSAFFHRAQCTESLVYWRKNIYSSYSDQLSEWPSLFQIQQEERRSPKPLVSGATTFQQRYYCISWCLNNRKDKTCIRGARCSQKSTVSITATTFWDATCYLTFETRLVDITGSYSKTARHLTRLPTLSLFWRMRKYSS